MNKIISKILNVTSILFAKKIKIDGILILAQRNNGSAVGILKESMKMIDLNPYANEWKSLINRNINGIFLHNDSSVPPSILHRSKFIVPSKNYISKIGPLLCASMLIRWASVIAANVHYDSRIPIEIQLLFLSQYNTEEANRLIKWLESYYKEHHFL